LTSPETLDEFFIKGRINSGNVRMLGWIVGNIEVGVGSVLCRLRCNIHDCKEISGGCAQSQNF